jgi:hypothetical protein
MTHIHGINSVTLTAANMDRVLHSYGRVVHTQQQQQQQQQQCQLNRPSSKQQSFTDIRHTASQSVLMIVLPRAAPN